MDPPPPSSTSGDQSIHAAKFTADEVNRLKDNGNIVVNAIYLKRHKAGRDMDPPPPSSTSGDAKKIDEWINKKYVQKKWYKEGKKRKTKPAPEPEPSDSDSDSSSSSSSTPEPVVKKKKRGRDKKKKGRQQKTKVSGSAERVPDLFQPAPTAAAPAPTAQTTSADDWASWDDNNWDPFDSQPAAAPPQQVQVAPQVQQQPQPQGGLLSSFQPQAQPQPQRTNNFGFPAQTKLSSTS